MPDILGTRARGNHSEYDFRILLAEASLKGDPQRAGTRRGAEGLRGISAVWGQAVAKASALLSGGSAPQRKFLSSKVNSGFQLE